MRYGFIFDFLLVGNINIPREEHFSAAARPFKPLLSPRCIQNVIYLCDQDKCQRLAEMTALTKNSLKMSLTLWKRHVVVGFFSHTISVKNVL